MVFSSISFIFFFLPIILIAYFLVPNKYKNFILFIFSMLFYAWGEPIYILLMMASILSSYINGLLIEKYSQIKLKKLFLGLDLLFSLGSLAIFKYTDFFLGNINNIFNLDISLLRIALPIGISFYTFQTMSYTIDIYLGKIKAQKNFINLGTYVVLFPQLIAGPIIRYADIEKKLIKRNHSFELFASGIRRFIIGLGKKVILANNLGLLCSIFADINDKSVVFYWLYGLSYMLQIYFDFSGYSDMAIGLGMIFGFKFLENFNYPYIAKSITDFWRRWHISLSSWFRDYLYIPLGGKKVSKIKWLRNILIVWFLTGLWHGAAWNFIIWGLYFGILLILEKLFIQRILDKLPKITHYIYTLFIVYISWIIFNANSLLDITLTLKSLFGFNNLPLLNEVSFYYLKSNLVLIIISVIGATPLINNLIKKININERMNKIINLLEPIFLLTLLIIITSYLIDSSFNPFIYFRF